MPSTRSATLWAVYYVVYITGFVVLITQSHSPGASASAMWLPFAFPPVLVWIAAIADRAELREPPPPSPVQVSVVTGKPPLSQSPPRTLSAVSMGMVAPFTHWVFPESASPAIRLSFVLLMLACAGFAAFVLPRLQTRED